MSSAEQATPLPLLADPQRSYILSRWVFLRLLGLVYLIAFWSLGVQIIGLVGRQGILPIAQYLPAARGALGRAAYWQLPTLCWFSASDTMLRVLCISGCILSVLLVLNVATRWILQLLWLLYLSLAVAGQTFLNFQWDALLLETGLLAVFYAPAGFWPRLKTEHEPPTAARWMLWLLVFKLMFLSGITKLLSGDPTWRDLSAMTYHYQTQPLPTWTSWYAWQWPRWLHQVSTVGMYIIEIAVPFLIFVPQRLRVLRLSAAGLMAMLQVMIAATGNYGFFNLLSVVLCLTLVDDGCWSTAFRLLRWSSAFRLLPTVPARREAPTVQPERALWQRTAIGAACVILPLSALAATREIINTIPGRDWSLGWADHPLQWVMPLRSINGYGLFRVMTTERPEIIVEGSNDGATWHEYAFRYKPGDVDRRPVFCAPHMPRLDWQLWFAALGPQGQSHWLAPFAEHLLRGTPEVQALLADNPFSNGPPRYLRFVLYDYRFAPRQPDSRAWWSRKQKGQLWGPLSLKEKPAAGDAAE